MQIVPRFRAVLDDMINLDEPPILCVDDTEEQRYVTVRILRSAGYRVIEAATGLEALRMMSQGPLAVVLDVNLPDMIGYEVCRQIRLDPQMSSTPVLQVSAMSWVHAWSSPNT